MSQGNGVADKPRKLSRVQRKMLQVLADGRPHIRRELVACLYDDEGRVTNIHPHLVKIRKVLADEGDQTVVCIYQHRRICYQLVRLIPSALTPVPTDHSPAPAK